MPVSAASFLSCHLSLGGCSFPFCYFKWWFLSYTPVETQTPDEIPTEKVCLDMPADVFDEKEELPEPLCDQQNACDSLDDDPTWSPEELERAYKTMKDDDDDSPSTNENPRYMPHSSTITC